MLDRPSLVTTGGTKACACVSAWGPAPPTKRKIVCLFGFCLHCSRHYAMSPRLLTAVAATTLASALSASASMKPCASTYARPAAAIA